MDRDGPLLGKVHAHAVDGEDASAFVVAIGAMLAESIQHTGEGCVIAQDRVSIDVTLAGSIPIRGGGAAYPRCCEQHGFRCELRDGSKPGLRFRFELIGVKRIKGRLVADFDIEPLPAKMRTDDAGDTADCECVLPVLA